jgi:hypothetical protein
MILSTTLNYSTAYGTALSCYRMEGSDLCLTMITVTPDYAP